MKNYGFIPDDIKTKDFKFGGVLKLAGEPLTDGHWSRYLPLPEVQAKNGIETDACTSFGTLNALEILANRQGFKLENFSDRFSAITSGTDPGQGGNSPQTVVDTARKAGLIPEPELPFDDSVSTVQQFYSPKPMTAALARDGQAFLDKFKIGHEWVGSDPDSMKEALKFSPLGVSVAAWFVRGGRYYFPQGVSHNHWCCLYDYVEGEYWLILDSYPDGDGKYLKEIEWGVQFGYVKRYSLTPNNDLSLIQQILAKIALLIPIFAVLVKRKVEQPVTTIDEHLPPPTPAIIPQAQPVPPAHISKIQDWALAIQKQEGFFTGSRSHKNNNPGNLKFTGYVKSLGATGRDADNFAIFPNYQSGFAALCSFLTDACQNELAAYHNVTLAQFIQTYAQPPDGGYLANVAAALKVSPDIPISQLK